MIKHSLNPFNMRVQSGSIELKIFQLFAQKINLWMFGEAFKHVKEKQGKNYKMHQ
jgi:hypothetical protein